MNASTPEPSRLLTMSEVAERLAVTERMARRLLTDRRMTVVKVGRHVRVWSHDVNDYIAANTQAQR